MKPIQFVLNGGETSHDIEDQIARASIDALARELLSSNAGLPWKTAMTVAAKTYAKMMEDENYADED